MKILVLPYNVNFLVHIMSNNLENINNFVISTSAVYPSLL